MSHKKCYIPDNFDDKFQDKFQVNQTLQKDGQTRDKHLKVINTYEI